MYPRLYEHQEKAVQKCKNGSVLRGGVGTGKSITSLTYYVRNEKHRDVYVITTARKRDTHDWEMEAKEFGIFPERELTSHGQLVVDSWNNLSSYKEVKDAFFIFDEQRLVGSGAWVKAFLTITKNNRWILLTSTPGDVWMDYIPLFVAHGFYKNRTEFIRRHVVYNNFSKFPKVDRYVETSRLEKLRREIVVEMPYDRHTTRHTTYIKVGYDIEAFQQVWVKRWHIYEDRPIRDIGELFRVMRRLVNQDPSRYEKARELAKKHPKLIIFYSFDYELEILRRLEEDLEVPLAEWNGHKHEEIPETARWVYLVQYTAGAEAWNCVETDAILFYSLNYSYRLLEQAQGRIDRLNTPFVHLWYYFLKSDSMIDRAIDNVVRKKRNFNEKSFMKGVC